MTTSGWVQAHLINPIETRDHRLMRKLNSWRAPRWIRLWMICATRGGDGWLWYALLFAVALFGGEARIQAIATAVTSTGVGILTFLWLKKATKRKRPCALEPHCWATLLPPDQFSFPSGHTITAFAMAGSLSLVYASLAPVLVFCAISIAVSRVILGMHFLSDVVAGSAIGSGLAYAAYSLLVAAR
jgi:undecaprenyl-diphosphatase